MRPTKKSKRLSQSSGNNNEVERTAGGSDLFDHDYEGPLTAVSQEAVGNLLKRVKLRGTRGLKLKDRYLNRCDFVDEPESRVEATVERDVGKGKNILQPHSDSVEEEDDGDESIWEDGPFPTSSSANTHTHDVVNELTIEFEEGSPDSGKQKTIRRATAEEKELAELVHKVHLLCLLARARLIDRACDDLLIQASLLSLLPDRFMWISKITNLKVDDLDSLVRWLHDTFRVRSPSNNEENIHSALQFALGNKEGTAEEVTALSVALFRALNFTTRFVAILDVASLKPEADKAESVGRNLSKSRKNIFQSSTLMVDKLNQSPFSPVKRSSSDGKENTRAKTSKSIDRPLDNNPTDTVHTMKSGGSKRKGDLEFEMQLEMALASTAVGNSNNFVVSSPPAKKLKPIKAVESSSQGISTAFGSKKVSSPLYWAEVYCSGVNSTGKWVHIDVVNNIVNAEERVEAAAAACKTSLRYVVAFAGLGAKDVTRRYCTKWYKIEKQRIDPIWWDNTLAPLKELELRATSEVTQLEPFISDTDAKVDAVEVSEQSIVTNHSVSLRSSVEDMELETKALTEPLPTNQQAYKNHHLYALERWLTKYQTLYPKGPILGFCSGHPVYPRTCVQMLHSKIRWLHEGVQVRANEIPAKVLKRTSKLNKGQASEADDEIINGDGKNTELYGMWQTEPLCLPRAVDGKVPKNERGQVDVWSEKCLPPGTVHLRLPRVALVAKRLGIDYAPAMVGFEFRKGGSTPVFEGIVVCTEFKDSIIEAFAEEEERRESEEKKRTETQALSRWYQLLSSIVTRQRLNDRYGSGSISTTSNLLSETKDTNQDGRNSSGCQEGNLPGKRKDDMSMVQTEEHEHVFSIIDQDYDEESFTRIKRCRCGFSIEVEEL